MIDFVRGVFKPRLYDGKFVCISLDAFGFELGGVEIKTAEKS